ncbi:MAG: acyl carrier protein [Terriglobales bacterium]
MNLSSATPSELQVQLRRLILVELALAPAGTLDPDAPLFEALLDSTSILALVSRLEQEFQVQIEDHELVPANFSTLRRLTDFLTCKTQRAQAPLAANGSG